MSKIIISSQYHVRVVKSDDIIFCEADNCYTHIYLLSDEKITMSKSLSKFSKELVFPNFIRVNQSYLVNSDYIKSVDKKKKFIEMMNQSKVHFTIPIKELLNLIGDNGEVDI